MSDLDRVRRSIAAIVRELFPRMDYLGAYEYRVVSQDGALFDLRPGSTALGLPDLARVPMRPGLSGSRSTLAVGSSVVVSFINGDATRPFIAWTEAEGQGGFKPESSAIDAETTITLQGGTMGAVRVGDTAGPYVIAAGSTKVLVG